MSGVVTEIGKRGETVDLEEPQVSVLVFLY